jgi:hypothetical protein
MENQEGGLKGTKLSTCEAKQLAPRTLTKRQNDQKQKKQ